MHAGAADDILFVSLYDSAKQKACPAKEDTWSYRIFLIKLYKISYVVLILLLVNMYIYDCFSFGLQLLKRTSMLKTFLIRECL